MTFIEESHIKDKKEWCCGSDVIEEHGRTIFICGDVWENGRRIICKECFRRLSYGRG